MAAKKSSTTVYGFITIAMLAFLPIVQMTNLVDFNLVPRQMLVSLAVLALAVLFVFREKKFAWAIGGLQIAFFAFLLVGALSISQAINSTESWATLSRYLLMFSVLLSSMLLLKAKKLNFKNVLNAMLIFGGIASLSAAANLIEALNNGQFLEDIYAVTGRFGHKNLLASALMLSLPFSIMGIIIHDGWLKKVSAALTALLLLEIFVLRTRGVWVATFGAAGLTVLSFYVFSNRKALEVKFPLKWLAISGMAVVAMLVLLFSVGSVKQSVSDSTNLDKRFIFWKNSMEMVQEHPVLGVGLGNWKINFPKYGLDGLSYPVSQGITHVQRPHNDYLWVLAETGPLGLLFYLAFFILAFARWIKNLKGAKSSSELGVDLILGFGFSSFLIFSLTDFPLERTPHTTILMLLIALLYRNQAEKSKVNVNSKVLVVLVLVFVSFSAIVSNYRISGEKYSAIVLQGNAERNAQKLIPAAESAVNAFYNMDSYANPLPYYSSMAKLVQQQMQPALQDGLYAEEIHPYNIITLVQMGNIYKTQKNRKMAFEYYDKALAISSRFELAIYGKTEFLITEESYRQAFRELVMINPKTTDPRFAKHMSFTLQQLVRNRPADMKPLLDHIESINPRGEAAFIQAYLGFLELNKKAKS